MLRLTRLVVGDQSLHKQLLLWLLLPQLVLWLAAAFVTYNVAARYANRAIDASLSQSTRSLARQIKPVGSGLLIDFPKAAIDIMDADPDDRVYYMASTPPGQYILGSSTKLPNAVHLYEAEGFRHVPPQEWPPQAYTRADVFMEMLL